MRRFGMVAGMVLVIMLGMALLVGGTIGLIYVACMCAAAHNMVAAVLFGIAAALWFWCGLSLYCYGITR